MEDNLIAFLGRFHPLIVHLPIGFLFMAGLLQLFSIKNKKLDLNPAISFTLLWGTIASTAAVVIGWLLSLQGGYDVDTLFWHKWLGVFVTILSFFGWLLKTKKLKFQKKLFSYTLISIILLISVSGHLGGSLTHGESYLTHYAPNFIKVISGTESENKTINLKTIPEDSISVFPHIIQPILNNKCVSCHNPNKKEGGLLLTNHKELVDGSKSGSIINTQKPLESEFLNRLFFGYDIRFLENNDYNLDFNGGIGYAFKNNNSLRLEYYNGYLPYSRLENEVKTSWISLAFYYNLEL